MNALFVAVLCLLAAGGTHAATTRQAGMNVTYNMAMRGEYIETNAAEAVPGGRAVCQSSASIGAAINTYGTSEKTNLLQRGILERPELFNRQQPVIASIACHSGPAG